MKFQGIIHKAWLGISVLVLLGMLGCQGSDDGEENMPPPLPMVTVRGEVHDGTEPIAGATCRLVDHRGVQQALASADASGAFDLQAPPEAQGFMQCTPPQFTQFHLSAFVSTVGKTAGDTVPAMGREPVSPRSTVVAILIAQENPADPQARKEQLVAALAAQDPALTALVEATATLVQSLVDAGVDVAVDTSTGSDNDGNDNSDSDAGGASGSVNDGAEFSPIPSAVCEFVTDVAGAVLVDTVLHDLFADGQVTRPDLQAVAATVNQALATRTTTITAAFTRLFPLGIGHPLRSIAANKNAATPGSYFLAIPPRVSGFVRCHPQQQDALLLATFIPARKPGELLTNQNVTPAATVFSLLVATRLRNNLPLLQENFEQDIAGLQVGITPDNGPITGFEFINEPDTGNNNVKLVVFAATALFNSFFKEKHNADFWGALGDWLTHAAVDPLLLADDPALSPQQAEVIATVMNDSTAIAAVAVGTELETALSTAQLRVRVRAAGDGEALEGVSVALAGGSRGVQCQNCPAVTDTDGVVTLMLVGVPRQQTVPVKVRASFAGFHDKQAQARITILATVTVDIELSMSGNNTGSSRGSN